MIRGYYETFTSVGSRANFELLHGVPGDEHLPRLFPEKWRPIADKFPATFRPLSRE